MRKKKAEAKRIEGNQLYKEKKLAEALKKYEEALELDENELACMNNIATVYYEMKEFEKCIEVCDIAID